MAGFEGDTIESDVQLTSLTASKNAGFGVQRKTPGQGESWQEVRVVELTGDGGTTGETRRYRFADKNILFGTDELRFRLRRVDL